LLIGYSCQTSIPFPDITVYTVFNDSCVYVKDGHINEITLDECLGFQAINLDDFKKLNNYIALLNSELSRCTIGDGE